MQQLAQIIEWIQGFLSKLFHSIMAVPKVILLSKFFVKIPKTAAPRAVILGNGPSLKYSIEKDLDFIKNSEIFCVNNFASYAQFVILKPANYVLLDPAFFSYSLQNNGRKDIEQTLFSLKNINWHMNFFIPTSARKSYLATEIAKNTYIKIYYFNYTIVKGFSWLRHWLYNQNLGTPQCQNILGVSLFVAIHQRFREIYLFGADHSWHEEFLLDKNNELVFRQLHFYDQPTSITFEKMSNFQSNKIYMAFASLAKAFFSYEVLNHYARENRVAIFNASKKSYIDEFEKIKI